MAAPLLPRRDAGMALLDALVALLLVTLLAVGLLRMQSLLHHTADAARRHGEATQVARQELDRLRDPARAASTPSPAYAITRRIDTTAAWRDIGVAVHWADRASEPHRVELATRVAQASTVYDAVLGLAPQDAVIGRPFGRSDDVPFTARSRGDGRSLWQPRGAGDIAWLFDDTSGEIVSRCSDATGCEPVDASSISGHVRFSLGVPADAAHPPDAPLPLRIALVLDSRGTADCAAQPVLLAGERFTGYACVITDLPASGWSGRVRVEPQGWTLGTSAHDLRVCRYSADLDHSGAIDRNDEHPARYTAVRGNLRQQNYLVVRGDQPCPGGGPHNDGSSTTAPHQP